VLKSYGGVIIPLVGEVKVKVRFQTVETTLTLIVVRDDGPALLGRDWIYSLDAPFFLSLRQLSDSAILQIADITDKEIAKLLDRFDSLFQPGLGTLNDVKVSIQVDPSIPPKFCKARPVPFALKSKVDLELDYMIKEGIITSVRYSKWAAPIVPVLKPNGRIRICGDYKVTANKAILCDTYPLPKIKELLSRIAGGKYFAKLDLSNAFNQLELDEGSKEITTINTHRGLFQYNRMCYGISCAPSIFQCQMESLMASKPGVLVFADDILVSGPDKESFLLNLSTVLSALQQSGLRLNRDKCSWNMKEINYLGFRVNADGISPRKDKLIAVSQAPIPTNVTELQSFLGLLNFYRSFLPNISTVLEPLNKLLRKDVPWKWSPECTAAYTEAKKSLENSKLLVHFNPELPIVVAADSSSYGIGAVLSHVIDGAERPVLFTSRTLNKAERNYSQLEREALALVFALKQFHYYVYGTKFTLKTDHKPLLGIFGPSKLIPSMASGRIIRWCLMLQAYRFDLVHTSGKLLGNADFLSRLPLPNDCSTSPVPAEWVDLVNFVDSTPVTARQIAEMTKKDPQLSKVMGFCLHGWPGHVEADDLLPYWRRRSELSLQSDCVLWGTRVVVPERARKALLTELHSGHTGSTRMKQLARSYFWWPNLDADIEGISATCSHCLENRSSPPATDIHPWSWPDIPWHRLHIDYAGPMHGYYFLVIVDATTKWAEIYKTKSITSATTIQFLRSAFSRFGIPVTVVSDNAPNFTSSEFIGYLESMGIRHVTTAVYSPYSNGAAERMVRTFKEGMRHLKGEDVQKFIEQFLFRYRVTPHTTTGRSPAELMFGRKARTIFDLLHPAGDVKAKVQAKQLQMSQRVKPRPEIFAPGEHVIVKMFGRGPKWQSAVITKPLGAVMYLCKLQDGTTVRRHLNQIWRAQSDLPAIPSDTTSSSGSDVDDISIPIPASLDESTATSDSLTTDHSSTFSGSGSTTLDDSDLPNLFREGIRTRAGRLVRPPDRLDL
jgi:transposase InsO family protein